MLRTLFLLLALLATLPAAGRAEAQAITPCDCAKCLGVGLIKSAAAERLYSEGLALAESRAAWAKRAWSLDPSMRAYWEGQGKTLDDFVRQITKPVLARAHDRIGDELFEISQQAPECSPTLEGMPVFMSVDPTTCKVREKLRIESMMGAPCPSYYMAMLAHEVVHIEDCKETKQGRYFTPIELLRTEVRATQMESDVLQVLRDRLIRERRCEPTSYKPPFHDQDEALDFLRQAEDYDRQANADAP